MARSKPSWSLSRKKVGPGKTQTCIIYIKIHIRIFNYMQIYICITSVNMYITLSLSPSKYTNMWDIVQNVLNHDTYQFDDLFSSDWLFFWYRQVSFWIWDWMPTISPISNLRTWTKSHQQLRLKNPTKSTGLPGSMNRYAVCKTYLTDHPVKPASPKKKHPNLLLKIKIKNGSKKKAGIWLASNPHLSTTTSKSAVSASGSPLGVMQRIASWGCGGWIVRLLHEPQEVKISTIQRCHWEYHGIPHAALSSGRPTSIPLPGTQQMVKKTGDR